jgi:alkanesulfonate monooxygenase SsuD/methylene tetrahydromethanopterin reductase-like flavin-dependent oxidoreductase (luciferase family)
MITIRHDERMEIGISLSSSTRSPGAAAGRHLVAMARAAVDAGLASLSLGDHHVVGPPAGYFQNTPSLGRLLAEWSPTGRPAGCLFLLPQWPPVLVAEQVGTLAALHDGPFVVQTGLGWAPDEFAAMGQPPDHRVSVFEEGVRVVRSLLAGETVSSERFGFDDVAIGLVPAQPVDWWMGTANEAGLRRAARFGAAWYAGPSTSADEFTRFDEIYRSACDEHDAPARVMLRLDGIVLADAARAARLADDAVARGYRGMRREHLFAGDPAQVAEQLSAWAERGVDQIVTRTMGLSDADDLATIDGLGDVRARFDASAST